MWWRVTIYIIILGNYTLLNEVTYFLTLKTQRAPNNILFSEIFHLRDIYSSVEKYFSPYTYRDR